MIPLCFRADVERSGNYQITLEYQSEAEARFLQDRGDLYAGLREKNEAVIDFCYECL